MINQDQLKTVSKGVSILVGAIGIIVIAGWLFNIPVLKSILPDYVSMKFNAALCFVLSSIALWLLQIENISLKQRVILISSISLVLLISLLTGSQYVFGVNIGIDEFFIKDDLNAVGTFGLGRMAPTTAIGFILTGMVLSLLFAFPDKTRISQFLSLLLLFLSQFPIYGYLLGISSFYGINYNVSKIALHTSFAFFSLSIGLLSSQRGKGIVYIFTSNTLIGRFLRKIVPMLVVLELLLAWLNSIGIHEGLFSPSIGVGLFGLINLSIIIFIIMTNALTLNREETKQNEMQLELLKSKAEVESIQEVLHITGELAKVGGWRIDIKDQKLLWTDEVYKIHEVGDDFLPTIEKAINFYDHNSLPVIQKAVNEAIEEEKPFDLELEIITSKGNRKGVRVIGSIKKDAGDKVQYIYGACQDITKDNHYKREIITAKEAAEESDRLKSAFLANMSHEIRTPMNGILGFADLLKEQDLSDEEHLHYVSIIEKSGERMLNIINDLIDISKVESGQMEISISETNINEQIQYIHTFFKPEVEQKGMQITYHYGLSSKDAVINTDREKVYAILINLVKNAIKYSDHGSIEFGYNLKPPVSPEEKDMLLYYVKDTGLGIPEDKLESIFDRFIQVDLNNERAVQGAGLGLSITKAYVEMLGGKVWVESEPGKGSIFYFTIPYK